MPLARPITRGPSPVLVIVSVIAITSALLTALYHPVLTAGHLLPADQMVADLAVRDAVMLRSYLWGFFVRLAGDPWVHASIAPLSRLSHLVDVWLAGSPQTRPFHSHLTSLTLHGCNAVLLFALMRRIGTRASVGILLALVFALHPVHVGAIAGAAQRGLILGTTCALLAMGSHVHYARARHQHWRIGLLLGLAAAFLSHPVYFVLPILLLLLDVWPLKRISVIGVLEQWPFLIFLIVMLSTGLMSDAAGDANSALARTRAIAANLSSMSLRLIFPLSLSPFYPGEALPPLAMLISVPILLGVMLVWSAFRWKPLFVALAGFCVPLAMPLLSAPSEGLIPDAWLYPALLLPLPVIGLALSNWLRQSARTSSRLTLITAGAVAVLLAAQTYSYAMVWNNRHELYSHALARFPSWGGGYVGLVEASIQDHDLDSALRSAERAVEAEPNQPLTQFYLGTVLLLHKDGRAARALAPLRRAQQARPDWPECLQNLGVCLARSGKHDLAVEYLEHARNLAPHLTGARVALGHVYLHMGRAASARAEFQEALRNRPDWVVNLGLARAWAANEMPELALRHLAVAVEMEPSAAARAAGSPEFAGYKDRPGWVPLLAGDAADGQIGENTGFPAASSAGAREMPK